MRAFVASNIDFVNNIIYGLLFVLWTQTFVLNIICAPPT
jgi:hypothetical protein